MRHPNVKRRVVKVGGSLLLRADLVESLRRWIDSQPESETLVIAGGGQLLDAIRNLDQLRPLNPADVHWRCVDLLATTNCIFSDWFQWPFIETPQCLREACQRDNWGDLPLVVSPQAFYSLDQQLSEFALPCDWHTTSDSIAALLSYVVKADELVLLKSCDVDPAMTLEAMSGDGIVDSVLAGLASKLTAVRVEQLPSFQANETSGGNPHQLARNASEPAST